MPHQIIDAVMAQAIQAETAQSHPLFAWIVMRDLPEYPRLFVARFVADVPTAYARSDTHLMSCGLIYR